MRTIVIETKTSDYVTCQNLLPLQHPLRKATGRRMCSTIVPVHTVPVICPQCHARVL